MPILMASSISSINTSVPSGSRLSETDAGSEISQETLHLSKEGFAAAAEALLRDVDAKLVKELSAGAANDCPNHATVALQREAELRTEISHLTARTRELERKSTELWQSLQEAQMRLEQTLAQNSLLTQELSGASREVERLRTLLVLTEQKGIEIQKDLQRSEFERHRLMDQASVYQAQISAQQAANIQLGMQLEKEREDTREQILAKERDAQQLLEDKRSLQVQSRTFEEYHGASVSLQTRKIAELEIQVDKLARQFETTKTELNVEQGGRASLKSRCKTLEQELAAAELSKRDLHNQIQELKGNIRVCCRVRPALEAGCSLQNPAPNKLLLAHGGDTVPFGFDTVFGASTGQADVFNEVEGLVQSALDGYKVCIFAYGQTGSGKTHSMLGTTAPGSSGLIPRSLNKIFQASDAMKVKGWSWSLQASFVEIYNEGLRDLLRGCGDAAGGLPAAGHAIVHHEAWGTKVTNMTCVEVTSMEQIGTLMERASKQRAIGATDMNAVSSRSHSIFALYLRGTNDELGAELHGALHLVDLAGSERLAKSGSTGERLKETQNINKSLSSLVDVFAAKAEGRTHIPFRNSKLTHLMEPCLSGQGKTLMLVHVRPEQSNTHETLCTLRFAKQVSQCDTGGKPKRHLRSVTRQHTASARTPDEQQVETTNPRTPRTSRSSVSAATTTPSFRSRSASATRRSRSPP